MTARALFVLCACVLIASSQTARAQDPPTATVSGVVVDIRKQPVSRALVRITDTGSTRDWSALTDESGLFALSSVPHGRYRILTTRAGYIASGLGIMPNAQLDVGPTHDTTNLRVILRKGGSISGTILDEFGEPLQGTAFAIVRGAFGDAARPLATSYADSRGRYRLSGLPPGEFVIGARADERNNQPTLRMMDSGGRERFVTRAPTFHPAATSLANATMINVGSETDITGVDIRLQISSVTTGQITVRTEIGLVSRVSLQVNAPDGRHTVRTSPQQAPASTVTFSVPGMYPGRYLFIASAQAGDPARPFRVWAMHETTTDGLNPPTITMVLSRGARISGRAVFESDPPRERTTTFGLMPIGGLAFQTIEGMSGSLPRPPENKPSADMFTIEGVMPGTYVLQGGLRDAPEWTMKSAVLRGRDILDTPLELKGDDDLDGIVVTFTNQRTVLRGTIASATGEPSTDIALVVFSRDPRHWFIGSRRIQYVAPDRNGRYEIRGLPAGDYQIVALSDPFPFMTGIPTILGDLLDSGVRISLMDGEQKVQNLRGGG